jgi:hypothetical protein
LNIFIRLNSGGTILSYSDLLLSIAVAQWKSDARAAIHTLVDELNRIGTGFNLSQDFVLKAGLMLADISSVGFKVENFTHSNMSILETKWPEIRNAIVRTVELAASFGLNGQTLRADSALLPIAYYIYKREVPDNYVTHSQYASDREIIRNWLICSLLKSSGIWGSGLDTLLTALRDNLKTSGFYEFPDAALRKEMDAKGKSITFSPAEVDDLISIQYGDRRLFPLMSLLFTFVDLKNQFHIDHVFPISRFTNAKLKNEGIVDELEISKLQQMANELPNLQLLHGPANNEKRAMMPSSWLESYFQNVQDREHYRVIHSLGEVPEKIKGFEIFFDKRKECLKAEINKVINARFV